ncbi:hypothetical protein LTR93_011538 [Exophiala xenobiotica]|nr:hypothetical protein LTR93_011538 [Exophiala xenobiotica]
MLGVQLPLSTRPNRSKHATRTGFAGQPPVIGDDTARQERKLPPTEKSRPKRQLERFHVEYIKRSKYDLDRQEVLYEIKWLGYRDAENTWEPRENLVP